MSFFLLNYGLVFAAIGKIVTAASAVVALTPSTDDDKFVGKIISFIERFSVFNKK